MNRKSLVMSTLIAMVLLVVTFVPLSNQTLPYDPWVDIDGDGKIDGRDVAYPAASFGTLGDPTRNVNVTNLPLDQFGNLKVSSLNSAKIFPDLLVLSGGILSMIDGSSENVLFDFYGPFPEMAPKWSGGIGGNQPNFVPYFNVRFTYGGYPITTCKIKGRIIGALTITSWVQHINDYTYFRGRLDFEKTLSNGTVLTLFSQNISERGIAGVANATWNLAYGFSVDEPITISSDERISIQVFIEAKWYSTYGNQFWVHFQTEPDDFMVIIPIGP